MTYLERKFIYYTECQLATLESLRARKSTSQSELKRQTAIADGMVGCLSTIEDLKEDDFRGAPRTRDAMHAKHPVAPGLKMTPSIKQGDAS